MELRNRAEALFNNFVQKGTLGEGAQRTDKLSMMDRMQVVEMPLALETFVQQDNAPGVDKDSRDGFVRFDAKQMQQIMENGFMAELEQGFEELCGPTPDPLTLTDAQKAEMKESLAQMVEAGIMTQEEVDAALSGKPEPAAPSNGAGGEYAGSISRDENQNFKSIIETTGAEHDVECFLSDSNGAYFLNLSDAGDHLKATATRVEHTGEEVCYKEEMIIRN